MDVNVTADMFRAAVSREYGKCPFGLALMIAYPKATEVVAHENNLGLMYAENTIAEVDPLNLTYSKDGPQADPSGEVIHAMKMWEAGHSVDPLSFSFESEGWTELERPTLGDIVRQRVPMSHWGSWADNDGELKWLTEVPLSSDVGRQVHPLMDQALLLTNKMVDCDTRHIVWDSIADQALTWMFG